MSSNTTHLRIRLIAVGVAGLFVGLGGGYLWRSAISDDSASGVVKSSPAGSGVLKQNSEVSIPQAEATGTSTIPAELVSTNGEVHRKALSAGITQALNIRNPADRMRRFLDLLAHFRSGDTQSVVDGFRVHDQQGKLFYAEYMLFMDQSGRMDGLAAMERIKTRYTSPDVPVLDHHVRCMAGWAEASPEDAIKWWNGLTDGPFRDKMATSIVGGVAKTDMPRALEYLRMFPAEDRTQHAGAFVRECLEQGGPQRAAEWLKTVDMPSGDGNPFQVAAAKTLLTNMVNVPPAEKAAHFEPLLNMPWFTSTSCLPRILTEWGKQDAAAAGDWLAAHSSIPGFGDAAAVLTSEWRKTSPEAATEWEQRINQKPK